MKRTKAMEKALRWLKDRGGTGVIDRYGKVLAAGETSQGIAPETWLRLVANGDVVGAFGRLGVG